MTRSALPRHLPIVLCLAALGVWPVSAGTPPGQRGDLTSFDINVGLWITMRLVNLPGGTYTMGSPESDSDSRANERPQHQVTLSPFAFGIYEVTNEQFAVFLNAMGTARGSTVIDGVDYGDQDWYRSDKGYIYRDGSGLHTVESTYDYCAVNSVTWYGAAMFCQWLSQGTGYNCRLPTEAEQEYAWRCGTTTRFHFGDDAADLGLYAWYQDNKYEVDSLGHYHSPRICGEKLANYWGVYDTLGNVWEWAYDYFDVGFYSLPKASGLDPVSAVAAAGEVRAGRGGSYLLEASTCRSADRHWAQSDMTYRGLGFRVVLSGHYEAPPNGADLAPWGVTASSSPANVGEFLSVESWVTNLGNQDAGPFDVMLLDFTGHGPVRRGKRVSSLAAGASTRVTFQNVQYDTEGTFYFYCYADATGLVLESNESNNTAAGFVTVGTPDLVVSQVSGPTGANPGKPFGLSAVVTNLGAAYAAPFLVGMVGEDATGATCAAQNVIQGLAPGGYVLTSFSGCRSDVEGDLALYVTADTSYVVAESDEENNTGSTTVPVGRADITVTSVATWTDLAAVNQPFLVGATVINQGVGPSGAFVVGLYDDLSPGVVRELETVSGLSPGESKIVFFSENNYSQPGTRTLYAFADAGRTVVETDEANNIGTAAVTIQAPDLVVTAVVSWADPASVDVPFVVAAEVANLGTVNAGTFSVGIYDSYSLAMHEWSLVQELSAGASKVVYFFANHFTYPGTYTLYVTADIAAGIPETDETNNTTSVGVTVLAGAFSAAPSGSAGPVSLTVEGPATVAAGATVRYAAVLHMNDGSRQDVTAAAEWSVDPGTWCMVQNGVVSVSADLSADESVALTAAYAGGYVILSNCKAIALTCAP